MRRKEHSRENWHAATDELKSNEQGIEYWARVLSTSENDEESLSNLEELYTRTEDWRNCATILQKQASLATDEFQIVSGWFRVAEVAGERLSDSDMLQIALSKVLEVDPQNIDAMQQLEESYDACEMWEDKVGLLLQRLEMSSDSYEQGDLFESIAGLFEEKLGVQIAPLKYTCRRLRRRVTKNDSVITYPDWRLCLNSGSRSSQCMSKFLAIKALDLIKLKCASRQAQWCMVQLGDAQRAKFHFKLCSLQTLHLCRPGLAKRDLGVR